MRTELALYQIRQRALELGWEKIEIHLRHVKATNGITLLEAGSDLWFLIEEQDLRNTSGTYRFPASPIRVESSNGFFDVLDGKITEQEHEHTGTIRLINKINRIQFVQFLQVTPKRKRRHGKKN